MNLMTSGLVPPPSVDPTSFGWPNPIKTYIDDKIKGLMKLGFDNRAQESRYPLFMGVLPRKSLASWVTQERCPSGCLEGVGSAESKKTMRGSSAVRPTGRYQRNGSRQSEPWRRSASRRKAMARETSRGGAGGDVGRAAEGEAPAGENPMGVAGLTPGRVGFGVSR
jgi:hypothetical protein